MDSYKYQKKAFEVEIAFYKSNPTEEEYIKFREAMRKYYDALHNKGYSYLMSVEGMEAEKDELRKLDDESDEVRQAFKKKLKEKKEEEKRKEKREEKY